MNPDQPLVDMIDNIEAPKEDGPTAEPGTDTGTPPDDGKGDSGAPSKSDDGEGKGGPEGGSKGDGGDDKPAEKPVEDTGYIADEGDEDEPPAPEDTKSEPTNLSPDLQYVVDNLPTLSTRGKDGKTYNIKAAGQLPDDFEFATKRDELLFNQALAGQELKAQQLQTQYFTNQQNKSAQEFTDKENKDIRRDMGALQREGKLGKFQYAPDDPKFNDDPAVKEAQEVIDFMNKENARYLEDANKGGVLYHLSFRDAFRLMQADKPASTAKETAQQKEDKERKEVTRKGAGSTGSAPTSKGSKLPNYAYVGDLKDMVDMYDLN